MIAPKIKRFQDGQIATTTTVNAMADDIARSPFEMLAPNTPRAASCWLARVTSNRTEGGAYNGKTLTGNMSLPSGAAVAEANFGEIASAEDCYLLNTEEEDQDTHVLTEGSQTPLAFCRYGGEHTDGRPILAIISILSGCDV